MESGTNTSQKEEILELKNLSAQGDRGMNAFSGINFDIKSGEIVGIAGVAGNTHSCHAKSTTHAMHVTQIQMCQHAVQTCAHTTPAHEDTGPGT